MPDTIVRAKLTGFWIKHFFAVTQRRCYKDGAGIRILANR
jgi:hypothetical protein